MSEVEIELKIFQNENSIVICNIKAKKDEYIKNVIDEYFKLKKINIDLNSYILLINDDVAQPSDKVEKLKNPLDKSTKILILVTPYEETSPYTIKNIIYDKKDYGQIAIIYEFNQKKNKIKLFGQRFVRKNKSKCHILINNKKIQLCSYIKVDSKIKNEIKIRLIIIEKLNDISYMFFGCKSFKSFKITGNFDTKNLKNISHLFEGCSTLTHLPDISDWNTKYVMDMSNLVCGCSSLINMPDISRWNTDNVINMRKNVLWLSFIKRFTRYF